MELVFLNEVSWGCGKYLADVRVKFPAFAIVLLVLTKFLL